MSEEKTMIKKEIPDNAEACINCKYCHFDRSIGSFKIYQCRRIPPYVTYIGDCNVETFFPEVKEDWVCGEFKLKCRGNII